MKKLVFLVVGIILIASLVITGCTKEEPAPAPTPAPAPAPAPVVAKEIRIATFLPEMAPPTAFVKLFKERVEKYSNGALKVTILWPDAVPPPDAASFVEKGAIEAANVGFGYLENMVPGSQYGSVTEYSVTTLRTNGYMKYYNELLAKYNFFMIGQSNPSNPQGQVALFFTKPVTKLADMKGLQVAEAGGAHKSFEEALGMTFVPVDFGDYYTALERGTVQAYSLGVPGPVDFSLQPVTDTYLDETYGSSGAGWIVRLDWWNSLPQSEKDALTKAAMDVESEGEGLWAEIMVGVKKNFADNGMKTVKLSPDESKKFFLTYRESMWSEAKLKSPDYVKNMYDLQVDPNFARAK